MKKILVIEGSPRVLGNSDILSDMFISGAKAAQHEVEKIYLLDYDIKYCIDCEICQRKQQGCFQGDDFQKVLDKMIHSDVLVFVSPVYFYTFTAQMKTLMDRTYSAMNEISHKECYLITTAASKTEEYFQTIIQTYRDYIGCFEGMVDKGIILGKGAHTKGIIGGNPVLQEAYKIGKEV